MKRRRIVPFIIALLCTTTLTCCNGTSELEDSQQNESSILESIAVETEQSQLSTLEKSRVESSVSETQSSIAVEVSKPLLPTGIKQENSTAEFSYQEFSEEKSVETSTKGSEQVEVESKVESEVKSEVESDLEVSIKSSENELPESSGNESSESSIENSSEDLTEFLIESSPESSEESSEESSLWGITRAFVVLSNGEEVEQYTYLKVIDNTQQGYTLVQWYDETAKVGREYLEFVTVPNEQIEQILQRHTAGVITQSKEVSMNEN